MMAVTSDVVPSILAEDPETLRHLAALAESFAPYVQFDFMDGVFVPSTSISLADVAALDFGVPWEAHLMMKNPADYLPACRDAGARKLIFHLEAAPHPEEVIAVAREQGLRVGLALNPETPFVAAVPLLNAVESLLFLSVSPGYYGRPFVREVLDKIMGFRRLYPNVSTGIDGGVKCANILEIARTGVSQICVGSAIFRQPDPAASYRALLALIKGGP